MKERTWSRWRRAWQIRRQRRALSAVASLACDPRALRTLSAGALAAIFDSREIGRRWAAIADEMSAVCDIADGATGGVNPGDRRAVYYLVRALKPRSVLEIGTHVGASTVHIAAALRDAHRDRPPASPRLTTVDVEDVNDPRTGCWRRAGLARSPRQMAAALGCDGLVRFAQDDSIAFLERREERYDLVFLDGDHAADVVYREVPRALAVLRPSGTVLCHDYYPGNRPFWPDGRIEAGPFLALERWRAEAPSLDVQPLGELPWPTKRGARITSLAILTRRPDPAPAPARGGHG